MELRSTTPVYSQCKFVFSFGSPLFPTRAVGLFDFEKSIFPCPPCSAQLRSIQLLSIAGRVSLQCPTA